jgi:hypothetical protein
MRNGVDRKGAMPVGRGGEHDRRGTPAAGGNNHARLAGAISRWCGAAMLCLVLLGAGPARAQALPDANPLVQRDVPAEATAENAVVARDRALASGQRIAYDRMASQLGLSRNLSDAQIQEMVSSLVIESERITPRGYAARITVNFNPPGGMARAPQVAPPLPGAAPAAGPAVATIEAISRHRSFPEYAELSRRLQGSATVARAELVTISGEAARWRIALRSQPRDAAGDLAGAGVALVPGDPRLGEGWRLGLGAR